MKSLMGLFHCLRLCSCTDFDAPWLQNVISFGNQVKEFRNIFHKLEGESGYPVHKFLAEAIVAINIGANDILYKYMDSASVEDNNFMESLLPAYKSHLLVNFRTSLVVIPVVSSPLLWYLQAVQTMKNKFTYENISIWRKGSCEISTDFRLFPAMQKKILSFFFNIYLVSSGNQL